MVNRRRRRPPAVSPWPFVGMGGLTCCLFLYGASALVVPWWVVLLLLVVWVVVLVRAITWWTPHPDRLPWLAAGAAVLWFVVLVGGARLFGWSD